jgi:hypothetical protein
MIVRDPKEERFFQLVAASRSEHGGQATFLATPTRNGSIRISHPGLPGGSILAEEMAEIISLAQQRRIDIVGYLDDGSRRFKIRQQGCAE